MFLRQLHNDHAQHFFALLLAALSAGNLRAQNAKPLPQQPSAGAAIEAATKAAAEDHSHEGGVTILSNTQGVDFGPYIQKIRMKIQGNWFASIPNPSGLRKKGKAVVQFGILKDGKVIDLKTVESEGEVFDRPAIAAIASSNPFPPLPEAFQGKFLSLRMRFLYNPSPGDVGSAENSNSAVSDIRVQRATLIQETADSHPISYPEKAVREKTDGVVRLIARIAADGTVESVATVDGNVVLGDAASEAIRKWHFQPARENGVAVTDQLRIRVEFRSEGLRIRFTLFPWVSQER